MDFKDRGILETYNPARAEISTLLGTINVLLLWTSMMWVLDTLLIRIAVIWYTSKDKPNSLRSYPKIIFKIVHHWKLVAASKEPVLVLEQLLTWKIIHELQKCIFYYVQINKKYLVNIWQSYKLFFMSSMDCYHPLLYSLLFPPGSVLESRRPALDTTTSDLPFS